MVIAFQGASLQSSSAEFELLTAAKFGAGWAEEVKFVPPSSFVFRHTNAHPSDLRARYLWLLVRAPGAV